MITDEKTIVLGDEFDESLREVVLEVLRELQADGALHARGIGGSQEVETLTVNIGGKPLVVEAETYVGLSVRGDSALVAMVESMVKQRMTT